jgi:hypothetical protein
MHLPVNRFHGKACASGGVPLRLDGCPDSNKDSLAPRCTLVFHFISTKLKLRLTQCTQLPDGPVKVLNIVKSGGAGLHGAPLLRRSVNLSE